MGDRSSIEWTDATWNPVRGCAIVSKGCTNCYAMRQAHRTSAEGGAYAGLTKLTKGGPVWTGRVRLVPELLDQPLAWRRPRRIFVNSMSDLFHEDVSFEFIDAVFGVMAITTRHKYQVLTKRPQRMLEYFERLHEAESPATKIARPGWFFPEQVQDGSLAARERTKDRGYDNCGPGWPLVNVWLGVSVEDQAAADERIPLLLQTPAAVRWISAEPLLGPVDLNALPDPKGDPSWDASALHGVRECPFGATVSRERISKLDWVVAGGESGPGARPMHPDWARALRKQCAAAGVPFFFKQWGNWVECETEVHADERGREVWPITTLAGEARVEDEAMIERMGERGFEVMAAHGTEFVNVGKKIAGRELDGRTHDEYPA